MTKHSENPGSGSFLVRVWKEPREQEGEERPVRYYFRNLQTGEEHYLAEGDKLADALLRESLDDGSEGREFEMPADGTVG